MTYAALVPDPRGYTNDSLKFVVNEVPKANQMAGEVARDEESSFIMAGMIEQSEVVDYPMVVYNSYQPDNS